MESSDSGEPLPAYTYVPGGPWPHPNRSPQGHSFGIAPPMPAATPSARKGVRRFLRGVELFNAGYYWEAHEVWEGLWHADGRRGPTADVLKALIKLAAAGVKVREGRENGVRTHCRRAAESVRRGGRARGASPTGAGPGALGECAPRSSPRTRRGIPALPVPPVSRFLRFGSSSTEPKPIE